MNEGAEMVRQEKFEDGETMYDELEAVVEIPELQERLEAWEAFIAKYKNLALNEMCQEILWRAELYQKTDTASSKISQLAG